MKNTFRDKYLGIINTRRIMPRVINALLWVAMIVFWWVVISLTIDLPMEHKLRHSTDDLRTEYERMSERYDSLSYVLDNVIRRDENVFRKLFESNPYDLTADINQERIVLYEHLVEMDND
jgi:hypothetical protein